MTREGRGAAFFALLLTATTDPTSGRFAGGAPSHARALRPLRGLQASSGSGASASSSGSGTSGVAFEVLPYEGNCPSVRTMVGDCNASIDRDDYSVACVVGPAGSSSAGTCDEPYSDINWFDYSAVEASGMGIEVLEGYAELLTISVYVSRVGEQTGGLIRIV